MLENPDVQRRLCVILKAVCVYCTFFVMAFFIVAIWAKTLIPPDIFMKVLISYGVILVGSVIIQRIFIESKKGEGAHD